MRPREEGRCFFRNSFSIRSRRISSSSSFTRARSTGNKGWSGSGFSRRQAFTQFPRVPSWIPRSRATSAMGLPVEITICTASALNCGLNLRRCSGMNRSSQSGRESLSKIFNTPQGHVGLPHKVPVHARLRHVGVPGERVDTSLTELLRLAPILALDAPPPSARRAVWPGRAPGARPLITGHSNRPTSS